ncbi:MAG: NADP-dependent malic enzyme [uncultured bacterium (gcode 4)]|uniref:NADP-dependent malic enzyme n=1 Tax=uncultured bacterium (gcode 4) TaxID=1234023 RepID=K2GFH2_9BACT|nr:MAG: NADP-dependent malic enzyme [uncultured bacterium (gcode 4)]
MNYFEESLELHEKLHWKLEVISKMPILTRLDLSLAYTPGVAAPCLKIAENKKDAYKYTIKSNTIAVISDWSAVLWLGNIGPEAGLPVMEGKCILLKEFAWVNAFPIMLDTQDTEEIIKTIKNIAPTFWGINLEDISAPRCFEIEERLKSELDIPVFHDDQHWTAIVCLAWIINWLKITGKKKENLKVVINWLWAAWTAILKLLKLYWVWNVIACDSRWIVSRNREDLNAEKIKILDIVNNDNEDWTLSDAIVRADIFIWVSVAWALSKEDVMKMNIDSMIFAMANPAPEILPDLAKEWGARIVATGRSDFPNQLNNVLVFPWIFKWALMYGIPQITDDMKLNAAQALADYVKNPTEDMIIPDPLDKRVVDVIADSLKY